MIIKQRCTEKKWKSEEICGGELKPKLEFFKNDGEDKFKEMQQSFKKMFGKRKDYKPLELPKGFNCIVCGKCYNEDFKKENYSIGWLGGELKSKQKPLFVIDSSVLKGIFENEDKSVKMLDMLAKLKVEQVDYEAVTTLSSFLNALWQMDIDKVKVKNIQNIIDIIKIGFMSRGEFSFFEYKNKKKVLKEIVELTKKMGGD